MTLNDFSQMAQIIIAFGTTITAVYAYITSKKTTEIFSKQLKLDFFADYTKRYQEITLNFPENINEVNFDYNELEPQVKEKTLRYMRAYFDLCSEEYFLWKDGNIEDKVWKEWESGIKYAMSKTAFQKAWKDYIEFNTIYYKDFTSFINNLLDTIKTGQQSTGGNVLTAPVT